MRKLLPTLLACGVVATTSAALPLADNFGNGMPANGNGVTAAWALLLLPFSAAVPEPATNVLLICGLLTVGGLAIFLGKKLG